VAAGKKAERVETRGRVWPGLCDAHIHLDQLVARRLAVDLGGAVTRREAFGRIRRAADQLPADGWLVGSGWYNEGWRDDATWPRAEEVEAATGGRPALLTRKDGHAALLTARAAAVLGFSASDQDPAGTLKGAIAITAAGRLPPAEPAHYEATLAGVLRHLRRLGLTSVHSMDPVRTFRHLQSLRSRGALPLRVTWNLPVSRFDAAERLGIGSGWGDAHLRVWGVKAFLDGSLGSRSAEMLGDPSGAILPQADLVDLARRAAGARLNLVLHAVGDGAVRRALDALEPLAGAWPGWRPRIEHAQAVDPADLSRFRQVGAVVSMQPVHAIADRALVMRDWPDRAAHAYAWNAILRSGAVLAFGSDAPVEDPDPLRGMVAATSWRRKVGWFPELAISAAAALRAYTWGGALAVGQERDLGRLLPGRLCDLTITDGGRVTATVVGGQISRITRGRP
jgi:predicted amidohydrolase YtcJ